jgi:Transposase DDE domain group 1
VTSDGGLILVRELDERLGLNELVDHHLSDSRRAKNIQLPLADLLRQSIYSRLAGYEDHVPPALPTKQRLVLPARSPLRCCRR